MNAREGHKGNGVVPGDEDEGHVRRKWELKEIELDENVVFYFQNGFQGLLRLLFVIFRLQLGN